MISATESAEGLHHSTSLGTPCQNHATPSSKTETSDDPLQPVAQDSNPLNDFIGKRKRDSCEEGKKTAASTPKKARKSLSKNAKDKPAENTGKLFVMILKENFLKC